MLDLDRFKPFNDEFGHPGGDRLLKTASAAWLGQIRDSDLLARYGGDEFILLLPDAQGETAIDAWTGCAPSRRWARRSPPGFRHGTSSRRPTS